MNAYEQVSNSIMLLSPHQLDLIFGRTLLCIYTPKHIYFKPFYQIPIYENLALKSSIIVITTFKEAALNYSNNLNGGKLHLQRLLPAIILL